MNYSLATAVLFIVNGGRKHHGAASAKLQQGTGMFRGSSGTSRKLALEITDPIPPTGLPACHGDCDRDDDCETGLTCFHRKNTEAVPECEENREQGDAGADYCTIRNMSLDPLIPWIVGDHGYWYNDHEDFFKNHPLGRCEGDCDSDDDCDKQNGLLCFKSDLDDAPNHNYVNVPGCAGENDSDKDFCTTRPDPPAPGELYWLWTAGNDGKPKQAFPLGQCEGDCDEDTECQPGLVCWQRREFPTELVPGCYGHGQRKKDYCIERPLGGTHLMILGNNLANGELGLCQGDCDKNEDCSGDLVCYKGRSGYDHVPCCTGEANADRGDDFCIYPDYETNEDCDVPP